jgi:hypothetical protein
VFNATFSNISAILWRPVLVVEEAGVPKENHQPTIAAYISIKNMIHRIILAKQSTYYVDRRGQFQNLQSYQGAGVIH